VNKEDFVRMTIGCCFVFVSSLALADGTGTIQVAVAAEAPPAHAVAWLEGVPAAAWTLPKETPVMSQRGARFSPDFLVVVAGQWVQMPNDDRITHNVFSVSPTKKFDLGHYPQGESRGVKFEKPGVVELFCNIHENMHATVVIVPSTYYALPGSDGKLTLNKVPAGNYRLVLWTSEGTQNLPITVKPDAPTRVELKLPGK
jgi:plastocyanin